MVTSVPRPLEPSLLHPARLRIASIGLDCGSWRSA